MNELNETDNEDPKQLENEEDDGNMIEKCYFPLKVDNPRNWDKIHQNIRDFLVEMGPKRDDGV